MISIDRPLKEMTEEYLLLDSSIRDWVVLPVVLILVIVGLGRHYVQELIKSSPRTKAADLDEMRYLNKYKYTTIIVVV